MKAVVYSKAALGDLRRYGNMAARIMVAMTEYARETGARSNRVTRLVGMSGSRMRLGDFRVIFEETETNITVTKIAPRGGAYD